MTIALIGFQLKILGIDRELIPSSSLIKALRRFVSYFKRGYEVEDTEVVYCL